MKVPKFAILLTLSVMVLGMFAAASALTVPEQPRWSSDYFNRTPGVEEPLAVDIYYVGNTSIEEYDRINSSGTINEIPVYDRPSDSFISTVVVKANITGQKLVSYNDNGTIVNATATGSVFVMVNGVLKYISSSSEIGDQGFVALVHGGLNTITILYMVFDEQGTISWASDTILVRIGSSFGPLDTAVYTAPVSLTVKDNYDSAVPVMYNDSGVPADFNVHHVTDMAVNEMSLTADAQGTITSGSMNVTVNTAGSSKLIDDILTNGTEIPYSEQELIGYDPIYGLPIYKNVLAGDPAVQGMTFYFDALGVYPYNSAMSSVNMNFFTTGGEVGVIAFNEMGSFKNGWEIGTQNGLGGNYSSSFGVNVSSYAYSPSTVTSVSTQVSDVTNTQTDTNITSVVVTESSTIVDVVTEKSTVVETQGAPVSTVAVFFGLLVAVPVLRKLRR